MHTLGHLACSGVLQEDNRCQGPKVPPTLDLKLSKNLHLDSKFEIRTMGIAFDFAPERPEHIDTILNGLDRYNPETTAVFQDYVTQQCEDRTYDCYANLALLKL